MRGFTIASALILTTSSVSVDAGGIERLIFTESGLRIFPKLLEEVPEVHNVLSPKVNSTCEQAPGQTCILWKLAIPAETSAMELLPEILTGFNLWSQDASLNIAFVYNGITNEVGIPYEIIPGSNPPEIQIDEFGNDVIAGNFLVSTLPPEELEFPPGVVATTIKYVVPNLSTNTAETRWAGIYLNPSYDPQEDYQLERVIASEAGIALGFTGSLEPQSILNPVLPGGAQPVEFSEDDLQWARFLYPSSLAPTDFGILSGRAINGSDGSPLKGVSVFLIPKEKEDVFANSANWDLAKFQAFTDMNGVFQFPRLAPGEYLLAMASLEDWGVSKDLFDDWMFAFAHDSSLGIEFYDGAQLESNHEYALSFSPQLIRSAAILKVLSGQETSGVEVISNVVDEDLPEIKAVGSSNEIVRGSSFDLEERLKKLNEAEAAYPLPNNSGGGCGIIKTSGADSFSLLLGFFVLFLMALSARGLRKE